MRVAEQIVLSTGEIVEWWDDSPMFQTPEDRVRAELARLDPLDPRILETLIALAPAE